MTACIFCPHTPMQSTIILFSNLCAIYRRRQGWTQIFKPNLLQNFSQISSKKILPEFRHQQFTLKMCTKKILKFNPQNLCYRTLGATEGIVEGSYEGEKLGLVLGFSVGWMLG